MNLNYVDRLVEALRQQLRQPWRPGMSGGERVWFLVIEPERLRSVLARKDAFELATKEAGRRWEEIDISDEFGVWMAQQRYAERYFQRPRLAKTISGDFAEHLASRLKDEIANRGVDHQTVLALTGVEAIYGINKLSEITRLIEDHLPGNLLVFFPGEFQEGQYRFFDARDGWNYLAVPVLAVAGKGVA